MKRHSKLAALGGIAIMAAASMTLGSQVVTAADHTDAPAASADGAGDIGDLYAWHTDNDTVVAIITFAPSQAPGVDAVFDRDVLYTLHLNNTATLAGLSTYDAPTVVTNDTDTDLQINIRFAQNGLGDWGVQIEDLPGSDGTFSGAVDSDLDGGGGTRAHAGVFDDPFFFDLLGFGETLALLADDDADNDLTGFSSLDDFANGNILPADDALLGQNISAVVVEFDLPTALGDENADGLLQVWATSARITE